MNKRVGFFLAGFMMMALLCHCGGNAGNDDSKYDPKYDPYPGIDMPVFSNGYNIKKYINKPPNTKTLDYSVDIEYPAAKVVKLYEDKFKMMGWIPQYKGDMKSKKWESFIDTGMNNAPQIRQLILTWRDPGNKNEAFVSLRYQKQKKDHWNNKLSVVCQISPFVNLMDVDAFFDRLNKSGEYAHFMALLDRYRSNNGNIDFEKALEENKSDKLLQEYCKLIRAASNRK